MTLLLTLLVFALAFTIFGGIVGYVAGVNRRFELDDAEGPVNLATGGYNPRWRAAPAFSTVNFPLSTADDGGPR